jgi:single-strand DNA-binding protein
VGQYLKKGSKIYCEGRLQTRQWENKEGAKMYTTEISVTDMQMLDGRGDGGIQGGTVGGQRQQQVPQGVADDTEIPF